MKKSNVIQLEELRNRLREAEETLSAIRNGEVDSLVVTGPNGTQIFSLQGAEQPYRVFVEQMQQGAVTLTVEGVVLYANARLAELLGLPLQRIIGAKFTDFVDAENHRPFLDALAEPEGTKLQMVIRETAGAMSLPVALTFSALGVGDLEAVCMVVTDLTEIEQKRELVATLEQLTETQAQLRVQNEELKVARKAADAANDAKDEFLATLSHELRTPLTPVLAGVQSLEQDNDVPDHIRADLSMMRRNIELEARLIDDLLDLTRIVRGKIELRLSDIDVRQVAESVLEICAPDMAAAQISFRQEISCAPLLVRGDAVRIRQILWNVIRNAVKFTPAGGSITVRTGADRGQVFIEVTDSGIGMVPEAIARIFSPFEQAGREITRRFGGLGLGLAISQKLAELHGGTITAESPGPGLGSTFRIQLPLMKPDQASDSEPKPVERGAAPPKGRRLRILLVEDHEDTRRSMTRLLSLQHDVHPTASVADALLSAEQKTFDLLISDLGLPDGTGLELMREIRKRHQNLRGICLSGYGTDTDLASSRAAGFSRHLTKPITMASLNAAIAETTKASS